MSPKQWRVVLDAERPPACGDWLAANGMGPASPETVRFTFLDHSQADGFTFRNDVSIDGRVLCADKLAPDAYVDEVPWLHFSDCMEVVGVQRLDWRPAGWPHDRILWMLTVESLPSNLEFERRLFQRPDDPKGGGWWPFRR